MLLIEARDIKKFFADRLVLAAEHLKIYAGERIGIVGANGVGKTTLINILSQRLAPDQGWVKVYGQHAYITQLAGTQNGEINEELASKFRVPRIWSARMSGGEQTRFKIAEALMTPSELLFADEPTRNLDLEGLELLTAMLQEYPGAIVLIDHDRSLLDAVCTKIWAIEDGQIKIYKGNYSEYAAQRAQERERAQFEYALYIAEKKRLSRVIQETKQRIKGIKRPPKRMGNSEARLHKMGGQKEKATLERAVKNVEKRIEHLTVKEKPKDPESIKLDLLATSSLPSKVVIQGKKINKAFGDRIVFQEADFVLENNTKTALIGPNGCGKSTLLKMIMAREAGITIAPRAKIGYFSQDLDILAEDKTVIANVLETSIYPEAFVRLYLARLLFKRDDIYKKVGVLSGGERVKVCLAKILLQDFNLLILDEPTNYLDIQAIEVLEKALRDYDRALLFVSHDRRLIETVADQIMFIEAHKLHIFKGGYQAYLNQKKRIANQDIQAQIFKLENRLAEIIGRLALPSPKNDAAALDLEYKEIIATLKQLKMAQKK